jgi:hypothetical protein
MLSPLHAFIAPLGGPVSCPSSLEPLRGHPMCRPSSRPADVCRSGLGTRKSLNTHYPTACRFGTSLRPRGVAERNANEPGSRWGERSRPRDSSQPPRATGREEDTHPSRDALSARLFRFKLVPSTACLSRSRLMEHHRTTTCSSTFPAEGDASWGHLHPPHLAI